MLLLFLWISSLACLSSWEAGFCGSAMRSSQWEITTDLSESGGAASHSDNSLNQSATPDQKKSHFTRNSSTELNWTSEKSKEILFLHMCVCAYTQTYTADGFTSLPSVSEKIFYGNQCAQSSSQYNISGTLWFTLSDYSAQNIHWKFSFTNFPHNFSYRHNSYRQQINIMFCWH